MEPTEQVNAIAQLPPQLAIMRIENENIQALAAAHPRDHNQIRSELVQQIEAYPSFVRSAIYSKPVGKDEHGKMKYARGLSIRAAEAIAEAYGFCRIRCDVTPIDDVTVKVEATFTDYQKGRIWQDGGIVSKFYKNRHGKMTRIPDDRFYNVTVKAEGSKRVREVVLRSVPPGLRSEMMDIIELKIDTLLDDATTDKMIANFASKGVTVEQLEKLIGKTRKAGWTKEDRRNLLGVWNSLEQEETTIEEILNGQHEEAQANGVKKVEGPVSPDDFKRQQTTAETQAKIDQQKQALAEAEQADEQKKKEWVDHPNACFVCINGHRFEKPIPDPTQKGRGRRQSVCPCPGCYTNDYDPVEELTKTVEPG